MRVPCTIDYEDLLGDYGYIEGVVAECSRCWHETESYGTSHNSVRRCLVLMREECPRNENNFYIEADA